MKKIYILLAFALCAVTAFAQIPTNGLIAYYPFNGNANDASGNANHGVVNGATLTTDRFGNANKAYSFNGTSNYIEVPDNSVLNPSLITLSTWIKTSQSRASFIGKSNQVTAAAEQYSLSIDPTGGFHISIKQNSCTAGSWTSAGYNTSLLSNNTWHHVVGTFDGITLKLYIDAVLIKSQSGLPSNTINICPGGTLRFGKWWNGDPVWFNGYLDDVAIYNRALSAAEVQQLYGNTAAVVTTATPQLTLSSATVAAGSTMTINGKFFTPYNTARLHFFGAGGQYSVNVTTNAQGRFAYTYTATTTPDMSQNGLSAVKATDVITNVQSATKVFNITVPTVTAQSSLTVAGPTTGQSYQASRAFNVTFVDRLQRNYGSYYYPMQGSTANRLYSYKVEYQVGTGAAWQTLTTVTGSGLLNSIITKTVPITINTANANCQVRVTDNYRNTIIAMSGVFAVTPVTSGYINGTFVWDYSYPQNNTVLQGAAADGVSRMYLKVAKLSTVAANIVSSSVQLSASNIANTAQYLGKIKAATNITTYSTEANTATTLTATNSSLQAGNSLWFWYVAPDDFSDNSSTYNDASERTVNAVVTTTFSNGTTDITTVPIRIVRPPLMMVHGLGSEPSTWDEFHYRTGTTDIPFINSTLWKHKRAVTISGTADFSYNAGILLASGPNEISSNNPNSFIGNIAKLRSQGFAANKIDYVCHSMGGCVARTAIANQNYYNSQYNYGLGFVNKTITINTPHNSSPWADLLTEGIPYVTEPLSNLYNLTGIAVSPPPFLRGLIASSSSGGWQAVHAVQNLRISGGVNLPTTNVKHHFIASNTNTCNGGGSMNDYLNLADLLLQAELDINPTPSLLAVQQIANIDDRICAFVEWNNTRLGERVGANVLALGDGIVNLTSQVPSLTFPTTSGINYNTPNNTVSIFTNTNGLSGIYDKSHVGVHHTQVVGDEVKALLNSGIASDRFANTIAATNNRPAPTQNTFASPKSILVDFYDTTKVKIVTPLRNTVVLVDSSTNIKFHLKDTANLVYIRTSFQTQTYTSVSRAPYQNYSVQVSPNQLGVCKIQVTAAYLINGAIQKHIDTLSVSVQTTAVLQSFSVSPIIANIRVGQHYYPTYTATYNAFVANIPNNDPSISVVVNNPSVVSYNATQKYFVGLDTLSTFAVVSYKGKKDTIYFSVTDTLRTTVATENEEPTTINSLAMKLYPNPTQGQFTLAVENTMLENARITVFNIVGQTISEQRVSGQSATLDLTLQPQGMYFVRLRTEKQGEVTQKIQKF